MKSAYRAGTLADVRGLILMHGKCSPLSIERRYLSPLPVLRGRLAARLLAPPRGFSLVAERDGGLVAIATVAFYDEDRAELGQLVVDGFQRRGIGTAMLLASAREAGRRGFKRLVLSVHPDNEAVLPMVHASGLRARVTTRDGLTEIAVVLVESASTAEGEPHDRERSGFTRWGRVLIMD